MEIFDEINRNSAAAYEAAQREDVSRCRAAEYQRRKAHAEEMERKKKALAIMNTTFSVKAVLGIACIIACRMLAVKYPVQEPVFMALGGLGLVWIGYASGVWLTRSAAFFREID